MTFMKPCIGLLSPTCIVLAATLAMSCLSPACTAADVRIEQRILVDSVWAGHPVGFALLTDAPNNLQYVGYYNADRNMVIASRRLDSETWTKKVLPTKVGWDSHNFITIALDRDGQLHVAGNMHAVPLVYFRTTRAGDVSSLARVPVMVNKMREQLMTYPHFIHDTDGSLFFTYRDGHSGAGINLYNRYNEQNKKWTSLLDRPLFDGKRPASIPRPAHDDDNQMNAYPAGPTLGPDRLWHLVWVWRDTPAAETNHDLSYARSHDLIHWETVDGTPIELPITIKTPGVIVDPVPVNGGIINGSPKIGFDNQNRVVVSYHKFDEKGATQVYFARFENGSWRYKKITKWTYRWEPRGGGSIPFEVRHSSLRNDPIAGYFIWVGNDKHRESSGNWRVNPDTLELGERVPSEQDSGRLPQEFGLGLRPGFQLQRASDSQQVITPEGLRFVLRWQTLPLNRDRRHEGEPPPPSDLELWVLKNPETAAAASSER